MFNYLVYDEQGDKVFEGSAREVGKKFYITNVSTYANTGELMGGRYRVEKELQPYYPLENQEYYYYSLYSGVIVRTFWDSRNGQCLAHRKIKNMFRTKEQCARFGREIMEKLQREYLEERSNVKRNR